MSESRQYFMTIALSLEIESGTCAIYKTIWFDEAGWIISISPSECPGDSNYGYAEVCAVTFAKPTKWKA